ncbi:MAG TPA: serine hydrolase [Chloroflexota bacterium]|nr:serine hydrolase [Chloroflexota bacterium]
MLGLLVGLISIGPLTLRDLVSGLTFVRPPAATIGTAAPRSDAELQKRLDAAATVTPLSRGRLSAAVVDLASGGSATLDAERVYPAASLFKVPILLEVLAEEQSGRLAAETLLEIRQEDWTDGSGVLQARIGERLAVRELTRLMIQESDNIAALVLLNAVSAANVNATLERLGLHATRVVDHRAGDAAEHATSAADMSRLLVLLAAGQAVDAGVSEGVLTELERTQHVDWLGDGLPFWVKVAHKWGDLPQARHDAGVIFSPRATYAVAVLTEGGVPDETAAVISRISQAMYDYLRSRP